MKVKLKACLAGPTVVHQAGSIVEFTESEAERLIAAGLAEAVKVERAVLKKKVTTRG